MKKTGRRVFNFVLAMLLVILMLPLGSISVHADEAEGDTESLGATSYKVGDIIKFGHYEQDGNTANGKEEIEWQVLKVESDRVLVVSKYVLDEAAYHSNYHERNVSWESCSLREWLNNDFKQIAFSTNEQACIVNVNIANQNGNNTNDDIFLLSMEEVEKYFGEFQGPDSDGHYYNPNSVCEPTQQAVNNGILTNTFDDFWFEMLNRFGYTSDLIGHDFADWWLRDSCYNYDSYFGSMLCGLEISSIGSKSSHFSEAGEGVRPALYINLSSVNPNPQPESPKEIKYGIYSTIFDPSMLSRPSTYTVCNPTIAELCAILCQAVYHDKGDDEDWKVFEQMGFDESNYISHIERYSPYSYSIAYKNMIIDGEETNVIFFVLRGTQSDLTHPYEAISDAFWDESVWTVNGKNGSREYTVYKYCSDFGIKVYDSYKQLMSENQELKQKPTKIVFTGHSLGGATANLLGAVFSDNICNKDDVFVYTFGAIDCLPVKTTQQVCTISEGYENIHNIYNFKDTFGPNGNNFLSRFAAGRSGYGKFGHIDIFTTDLDTSDMGNHFFWEAYFPAVFNRKVKYGKNWRVVAMHCPVDIDAYKNGELVAKVINNTIVDSVTSIPVKVIDDEKYFLIEEGSDFQFEITSTAEGSMEYEILDVATGSDTKEFHSVQLTPGKTMVSFVDSETENEEVKLFAENESGKIVTEILEDGEEIPVTVQAIFKDVSDGAWYVPAVQYAYDNDIMTGKGDQTFAPNANLHREEFTQMLYKNEGAPEISISDNPFTDVKNAWYKTSVLWAKESGIVSGKSADRFGIGKNITREELALMLYKYAQYKNFNVSASDDLAGFTDSDKVSSWALNAVKWAVANGIISGKGSAAAGFRIDPQKGATRAECAAMMKKFAETDFGPMQAVMTDEEEPLALPMEEIEDIPVPDKEIEDVVDEEDVEDKEEDSEEEITDEEEPSETEPEEEVDIKFEE